MIFVGRQQSQRNCHSSCMRTDVAHKDNLSLGFLKLRRISGVQIRKVTAILTMISM